MKWLSSVLLSCILNLVLLLIILLPYKKRADSGGLYLYENIVSSVPTFKSFFFSNPGSFLWGKLEHIKQGFQESKRVDKLLNRIILEKTKVTKELTSTINKMKQDWYLTSEQSLKFGIIDKIL